MEGFINDRFIPLLTPHDPMIALKQIIYGLARRMHSGTSEHLRKQADENFLMDMTFTRLALFLFVPPN